MLKEIEQKVLTKFVPNEAFNFFETKPYKHSQRRWALSSVSLAGISLMSLLACTSPDMRPPVRITPPPTPHSLNNDVTLQFTSANINHIDVFADTGRNDPFVSSGLCEQDERGWWYLNGPDPLNEAHWIPCIDNT